MPSSTGEAALFPWGSITWVAIAAAPKAAQSRLRIAAERRAAQAAQRATSLDLRAAMKVSTDEAEQD
jgi:hypothetical protein